MEDFALVLTVVGTAASIVGVLLPAQGWRRRAIHVIYSLTIAAAATLATHYASRLRRLQSVEGAATALYESYPGANNTGYVLATLAFLEKNKDLYPDTYARALELCKTHDCLGSEYRNRTVTGVDRTYELNEVAAALAGTLHGLSKMHAR
jgi:hypothetical protein